MRYRALVRAAHPGALRMFDVNPRAPFVDRDVIEYSPGLASALKLNDQGLPALAAMFGLPPEPRSAMPALADRFGLALVALARGTQGACCWPMGPGRIIRARPLR